MTEFKFGTVYPTYIKSGVYLPLIFAYCDYCIDEADGQIAAELGYNNADENRDETLIVALEERRQVLRSAIPPALCAYMSSECECDGQVIVCLKHLREIADAVEKRL